MIPSNYLKSYLVSALIFFPLDILWITILAKKYYHGQIGPLLADKVNGTAAVVFYAIFLIGLYVFVIGPSLERNSFSHALKYGAFFGLITYATYDLTNLATLRGWTTQFAVVDMTWGTFLCAAVSCTTFLILRSK